MKQTPRDVTLTPRNNEQPARGVHVTRPTDGSVGYTMSQEGYTCARKGTKENLKNYQKISGVLVLKCV